MLDELESGKPAEVATGPDDLPAPIIAIAAVVLIAGVALNLWILRGPFRVNRPPRDHAHLTSGSRSHHEAGHISGRETGGVRFRSEWRDNLDIWVQQVAGGPANRLTATPRTIVRPTFRRTDRKSPSSRHGTVAAFTSFPR